MKKTLKNLCSSVYSINSLIAANFMRSWVSTLLTTGKSKWEHCESVKT